MSYNNKPDEFSFGISTYGTSLTVGLNKVVELTGTFCDLNIYI